jgi:hypothetical protein
MKRDVSWIFSPDPPHWGLRGTPYLWNDMREYCKDVEGVKTGEDIKRLLYNLFNKFTGRMLQEGEIIYVKKYNPGHGISAGCIAMTWWVKIGVPLLVARYVQGKSPIDDEEKVAEDLCPGYADIVVQEPYPDIPEE